MIKFLGLLSFLYALAVFVIAYKQPEKVWKMKKIQAFIKVLGEKGTIIFFNIWGFIFIGLGIWAFIAG